MTSKFFMSVLVPCSILLPIIIALLKLKQLPVGAKIIFYYLLVSAVISAAAVFMGRVMHMNNLPLIHLYTALEIIFFCRFYKEVLQQKRAEARISTAGNSTDIISSSFPEQSDAAKNNFLSLWLPLLFVLLCIINAVFFQSIYTYSSYTRSVEALICIVLALNYFARLAAGDDGKKTISKPELYFNSGIFLYFSGAFMLFVFSNFIINSSHQNYAIIWVIHAALVLCMYLFFSAAFLLCKR